MNDLGHRCAKWGAGALAVWLIASLGCVRSTAPGGPPAKQAVEEPAGGDGVEAPVGEAPSSEATASDPGCLRACARWTECAGAKHGGPDCTKDCDENLRVQNPKGPATYADCLEALACEDLVASLAMDSGPAGHCYTTALQGR